MRHSTSGRNKGIRPFNRCCPANGMEIILYQELMNSGFYYMKQIKIKFVMIMYLGIDISRAHGYKDRNLDNPIQIWNIRNNKIYVLADQRLRSHGGRQQQSR